MRSGSSHCLLNGWMVEDAQARSAGPSPAIAAFARSPLGGWCWWEMRPDQWTRFQERGWALRFNRRSLWRRQSVTTICRHTREPTELFVNDQCSWPGACFCLTGSLTCGASLWHPSVAIRGFLSGCLRFTPELPPWLTWVPMARLRLECKYCSASAPQHCENRRAAPYPQCIQARP